MRAASRRLALAVAAALAGHAVLLAPWPEASVPPLPTPPATTVVRLQLAAAPAKLPAATATAIPDPLTPRSSPPAAFPEPARPFSKPARRSPEPAPPFPASRASLAQRGVPAPSAQTAAPAVPRPARVASRPGTPVPGAMAGTVAARAPAAPPRNPPRGAAAPAAFVAPNLAGQDNPQPNYPLAARRRGAEGLVLLEVRVAPDGAVAEVALVRSSGHTLLDRAARRAVAAWRFNPARHGARAVAGTIEVPVRFQLSDS